MPHIIRRFSSQLFGEETLRRSKRTAAQSHHASARCEHAGSVLFGRLLAAVCPAHHDCAEPRVTRRNFRDPLPRHPFQKAPARRGAKETALLVESSPLAEWAWRYLLKNYRFTVCSLVSLKSWLV